MDKITDIKVIQVDNVSIECYILDNRDICLNSKIRNVLKSSFELDPHVISTSDNTEIEVYSIDEVIDGMKPRQIKELSKKGLISLINEGLPKEEVTLSDFDRLIQQSLDFNPNKNMETNRKTKETKLERIEQTFKQKNMVFQNEQAKKNPDYQFLTALNTELTILKNEIDELKDDLGIVH